MSLPKVMIVDDELSMRTHIKMMLENQGYDLQLLENGEQLIQRLAEGELPDLIILDVIMPGLDGFSICKKIKTNHRWQPIPVIMVTVMDAKEALVKGSESGADDFLQKPVNKLELQTRVRSMLRIKEQYDQLDRILHLREELSNMVVHDMSSPITSIQLHAALLEEQLNEPEQKEHLAMIKMASDRLDSFVNDMLMMAKLEQSKLHLNRSKIDVCEMARNAEKHFSIMAKSKNIQLNVKVPDTPINLNIDANLFSRVFANLLANALQYSPPESAVTLQLDYVRSPKDSRHHLKIQVKDQGSGIPEADRQRIFNKFEVVDLKKKGVKQIGLGLTFCKMVVDAHEGHIFVQANEPQGSIFVVEI